MSPGLRYEVVSLNEVAALPKRSGPIVLIVDDEQIIADTLSTILSRSGYAVMTAYDGWSALELARVHPPALLITDVVMPGMTGVELALAVREFIPDCEVLLFSGQAATVDLLAKARDMGHDFTLLAKPVHPTDMLRRVSDCFQASGADLVSSGLPPQVERRARPA